jgi:hypothetical protein
MAKLAYTVQAAVLIRGTTFDSALKLKKKTPLTDDLSVKLSSYWATKQLLIIDDISMVSKVLLARVSDRVTEVRARAGLCHHQATFGGLGIVIFSDIYQLSSPFMAEHDKLYTEASPLSLNTSALMQGQDIYKSFSDCFILRSPQIEWRDMIAQF